LELHRRVRVVADTDDLDAGLLLERVVERLADRGTRRGADIGGGDLLGAEGAVAGPDEGQREAGEGEPALHRGAEGDGLAGCGHRIAPFSAWVKVMQAGTARVLGPSRARRWRRS